MRRWGTRAPASRFAALAILALFVAGCGSTTAKVVVPDPRHAIAPTATPTLPAKSRKAPTRGHASRIRRPHRHPHPPAVVLPSPRLRRVNYRIGDLFGLGAYAANRYPGLGWAALARGRATGADWVREEITANDLHLGTGRPYQWW